MQGWKRLECAEDGPTFGHCLFIISVTEAEYPLLDNANNTCMKRIKYYLTYD